MSGSVDRVPPGTGTTPLTDAEARTRIETDTHETLFVDAGAGSGKTKSLVDRVRTLVLTDEIPLREIAAVTFTEKAGAELRDRLRVEFESAERDALVALAAEEGAAEDRAEWQRKLELAEAALDDLDAAAIGTLHSFAQRILGEHPIEAKLPPLIEVLDEIASSVAFEGRWAELRIALLDDASVRDPLLMAMASGVDLDHLRSLTRLLGNDWDLAVDRIVNAPPPPVPAVPDVTDLVAEAARIAALADQCWEDEDKLLPKLAEIGTARQAADCRTRCRRSGQLDLLGPTKDHDGGQTGMAAVYFGLRPRTRPSSPDRLIAVMLFRSVASSASSAAAASR